MGCGTTPLYRDDPCATAAAADGCDVTACSSAGETEISPAAAPPGAAASGCCAAPDSVVAVDAPVEREEEAEAEEASAAVGLMLSTIPMMIAELKLRCSPGVWSLLAAFLALACVLASVLCSLQPVRPVIVIAARNSVELLIRLYCSVLALLGLRVVLIDDGSVVQRAAYI